MKLTVLLFGSGLVLSHPVRVRGLKPGIVLELFGRAEVAPRAGAWVETKCLWIQAQAIRGRTPCGCVG